MSITVCMIAHNDQDTIGHALDSVKELADEIVVVDAGSTDNTNAIAQEKGVKVATGQWTDDYSVFRNEALKHATKEWIFILDADEYVEPEHIKIIKEVTENQDAVGLTCIEVRYTNNRKQAGFAQAKNQELSKGAAGFTTKVAVRLFKNNQGFTFSGKVNESVEQSIKNKGGALKATTVPIHHYGTANETKITHRKEMCLRVATENAQQDPSAKTHYLLGLMQKDNGKWEQAVQAQEKAIAEDPKFALAHFELGRLHHQRKNYDKAIYHFEEAVLAKPTSGPLLGIGLCNLAQGELDKARSNFKKALLINPNNPHIHMNLGLVAEKQKKYSDAIKGYAMAAKLNPKNASAFLNLGNAFALGGNVADAKTAYNEALKLGHPKKEQIEARLKEIEDKFEKRATVSYTVDVEPSDDESKNK